MHGYNWLDSQETLKEIRVHGFSPPEMRATTSRADSVIDVFACAAILYLYN